MNWKDLVKDLDSSQVEELEKVPALLACLPMIYVGWKDAYLSLKDIEWIRNIIGSQNWLTESEKNILLGWLNVEQPPTAQKMEAWKALICELTAKISNPDDGSLAELGAQIARIGAKSDIERFESEDATHYLQQIEEAIGIYSQSVYESLLPAKKGALREKEVPLKAKFDVSKMQELLDGEYSETRKKVRALLADPLFKIETITDKDEYRELTLKRCQKLAEKGLGSLFYDEKYGGVGHMGEYIATFETLGYHDLSLVVKYGVQFGLFGGSIHWLGSQEHHDKYLKDVGSLVIPGCFAMTEVGHGSNVRDVQTTAVFNQECDEFILHTPTQLARKDYIGNAALHGQMATVFAQLEVGGEHHGVHAFLVPIRNKKGDLLSGVSIEDCGDKLGLNGVDNGRIWFNNIRIPRENLLNRYANVSKSGEYSSPIDNASRRFFTMLSTLVGGRVCVSIAALSAAKTSLAIATKYAARRRQFGRDDELETLILDYRTHQRRLMPLLANSYALTFTLQYLAKRYSGDKSEADVREIEVLAAALKAYSTWNTTQTIQICRETCGGQGYLSVNRFSALKADSDVYTTFEGDNVVLLQLVAKGLLTEFKQEFGNPKILSFLKYISMQAGLTMAENNPVSSRLTRQEHLRDSDFHIDAFEYRVRRLQISVANRLKRRMDSGLDSYDAFNRCQDHVVELGLAHAEKVIFEQFTAGIERCQDPALAKSLKRLCDLYALSHIEKYRGWFLEHGYLEGAKSKAIRHQVNKLCWEVRQEALHLVDAYGIPEHSLVAPIAL